jgi:hypothetical protein
MASGRVTFDRDQAVSEIADQVSELVEPRKHREPFWTWTKGRHRKLETHVTQQGSLLDQLRAQLPPSTSDSDTDAPIGSGGAKGSPPLAVDVLDVLMEIETGSTWWTADRLHRDLRETVEDNLRLLVGAAVRLEDWVLKDLSRDVAGWYAKAATLTGWASPPFTPRAPCPLCGTKGTLRINPDQKRGMCVQCRETWDETNIGLLADQIKASDPQEMRTWVQRCEHSWRLTVVSPLGISGRCVVCHGMDVRRVWPKGTPVWTDLDEREVS